MYDSENVIKAGDDSAETHGVNTESERESLKHARGLLNDDCQNVIKAGDDCAETHGVYTESEREGHEYNTVLLAACATLLTAVEEHPARELCCFPDKETVYDCKTVNEVDEASADTLSVTTDSEREGHECNTVLLAVFLTKENMESNHYKDQLTCAPLLTAVDGDSARLK